MHCCISASEDLCVAFSVWEWSKKAPSFSKRDKTKQGEINNDHFSPRLKPSLTHCDFSMVAASIKIPIIEGATGQGNKALTNRPVKTPPTRPAPKFVAMDPK
ncbi:hypothetical protein Zmor_008252 [Zophobas morio]|uniref:Uncharacterized protein n=1 Tax=Zophobas morio TaxID=2755281 RepID=A0AA38J0Z9_9CUCU|nr:hypothetical protein Zmor_008252 [Zophobas morio]